MCRRQRVAATLIQPNQPLREGLTELDSIELMRLLAAAIAGYLFGSLPLAYLAARSVGVNIFEVGTGNPGAANTFRSISKKLGALVFVGDVAKGVAAVLVAIALGVDEDLVAVAAAAAITGHMYPVFLRFRGGAALATAIGGIVTMVPIAGGIGLASGFVMLAVLRSTGHAAAIGVSIIVIAAYLLDVRWQVIAGICGLGVFVFLRLLVTETLKSGWAAFQKSLLRFRGGSVSKYGQDAGGRDEADE